MDRLDQYRVLLMRPPFTRLKGVGQAPYFPLGIGYIAAVLNQLPGVTAELYYSENPLPGEPTFIVDKKGVFHSRSTAQSQYFQALEMDSHPVWTEIRNVLRQFRPDILGLSVLTPEAGSAFKVTQIAKELFPACHVVWGGVHPTYSVKETLELPGVDYVVVGEGEYSMRELVLALQSGGYRGSIPGVISRRESAEGYQQRELIPDLDRLPFPDRKHVIFPDRFSPVAMGSLMHSRGCPWQCGFCSSRHFWNERVRFRSPEQITAEIAQLIRDYRIKTFTFWDDAFTIDRALTQTLCESIIAMKTRIAWRTATRMDLLDDPMLRLMKRAGCVQLELGIESGSSRMLQLIKKDIELSQVREIIERVSAHGMACGVFFMAGFPDETMADLEATYQFMQTIQPAEIVLNIFDPMPGSEQFHRAINLGLLPLEIDYLRFPLWPDAHYIKGMKPVEFNVMVDKISRYVFQYNSSRIAFMRRARPEALQLLRSDPKVLLQKALRVLKHRFRNGGSH